MFQPFVSESQIDTFRILYPIEVETTYYQGSTGFISVGRDEEGNTITIVVKNGQPPLYEENRYGTGTTLE